MIAFSRQECMSLVLIACTAMTAVAQRSAAGPPQYLKKATWTETMLAARATDDHEGQRLAVKLGTWQATGPMKAKGFTDSFFPERGVDLQAKGPDGKPLWQPRPQWSDGQTQELPSLGGSEATYLFRTLTAKRPTTLTCNFSSDDGIIVWLNGRKLFSRATVTTDAAVDLPLSSGENRLLVKIHNYTGGYSYAFAVKAQSAPVLLWQAIKADFPVQAGWFERHLDGRHLAWFRAADNAAVQQQMIERSFQEAGREGEMMRGEFELLVGAAPPADDPRWLSLYEKVCRFRYRPAELKGVNLDALRRAVEDLVKTQGGRYPRGREFLAQLADCEKQMAELEMALARGDGQAAQRAGGLVQRYQSLRRDALLANPLLDFDRLLLVKRKENQLGLPQNWQGNCSLPTLGYDNEIAVMSPVRPGGQLKTLFRPKSTEYVGDLTLHFDAGKMLLTMSKRGRWDIYEIGADGRGLRQVTTDEPKDVDNYCACYLPDGRIIFSSTRCFQGVPCVGGSDKVANLFIMDADGRNVRQLCFDQDHDWYPTVLNNGRILYTRWEYSDSPHYFTRLLFHMNPDGTGQAEYCGTNSFWPNSTFYARPIPNHPTQVVGVISGHHGVPRMGELIVFDPALGRHRFDSVVQRIPGYGRKVKPVISDGLVEGSWPKFLHPMPLGGKYFLVSAKPSPQSSWGIYLVDIFDNLLLLAEQPGYALLEPIPLKSRPTPHAVPDQVKLDQREAQVYIANIYLGKGLQDVPKGTVKKLRIYEPHYAYPGMGGHINIGIDGPWDARRIWGTVPVEADGSANFRVPANTPLALQPLDADGKALQVMRSWFTAMPGEVVSCVGCHENQNSSPPTYSRLAMRRAPSDIAPWYGPPRGFSFKREVQPVLDKYCVGCHDHASGGNLELTLEGKSRFRNFTPSYVALHPFVRRPGPESDYFLQKPLEWHAGTSELIQMLEKGHYNVKLDAEARDRLITWIDLNVPDFGTWHETRGGHSDQEKRRLCMRTEFANRPEDPEALPGEEEGKREPKPRPVAFVRPAPVTRQTQVPAVPGWPFDADEAKRRQKATGLPAGMKLPLSQNVALDMVLVPAGEFVMGSPSGDLDETPATRVKIARPFYMSRCEITNAQYALFDAEHDSAYISMPNKDHGDRGYAVNGPSQPVVRINWRQAMDYCRWLSAATGRKVDLPSEAQWEWACRAGTATPLSFGGLEADFSKFANLADAALGNLARGDSPRWHPRVDRFNDGTTVTADVGRYQPNAWGLCDMHGNAAEWTRTAYRPYPYNPSDGRDDPSAPGTKVVRGGSWFDRPYRATSSFRLHYEPWQCVYNVGFRVILDVNSSAEVARQ